jgi:[FeFe] hydrogenase H-cluster maturation GTPase HydF
MGKGRENKPHIGVFGRRNIGKSSLINALTGQDVSIVSEVAGTTTDPVNKSIEIHGIGPVIIIDTAGIDDRGDLGNLRIAKTWSVIDQIDLAILVVANNDFGAYESDMVQLFHDRNLPYLIVHNKSDISIPVDKFRKKIAKETDSVLIEYSAVKPKKYNAALLKAIKDLLPDSVYRKKGLLGDLLSYGDIVLLITPIDIEAPEGRLILPQIQVIRDILDNECTAIILKEREVDSFLKRTAIKPKLVITDSQVFLKADASVPRDISLTSFSIVLARQKGDFAEYIKGAPKIADLKDGDRVLLLESCSHHVSCDDIGRIKIPRWISNFTGKNIQYDTVAGLDNLPRPIDNYALVIQCGGCMITHRQLMNRLRSAKEKYIPITNYGMAIAFVHGIFNRAIEPFVGKVDSRGDIF